jgi:hypothetical protein
MSTTARQGPDRLIPNRQEDPSLLDAQYRLEIREDPVLLLEVRRQVRAELPRILLEEVKAVPGVPAEEVRAVPEDPAEDRNILSREIFGFFSLNIQN